MIDKVFYVDELLVPLGRRSELGKFQFATQFEPLHDRLKIYIGKAPGKNSADSSSN